MEVLKKVYSFFLDMMQTVLLAASIFLVIYIFLFRPFQVSGRSMYPTFKDQEYILTNLIVLKFQDIKRGDVIVFKAPPDPDKDYIKRVIGLPGDRVLLHNGFLYINGERLDESAYLHKDVQTGGINFMKNDVPVIVPPDEFAVFGDNRPESSDTRDWGFLPKKNVIGESFFVYWPFNTMRLVKNPFSK
jgi:signal peptidase I